MEGTRAPISEARAPRNKTLTLTPEEYALYKKRLLYAADIAAIPNGSAPQSFRDKTACADLYAVLDALPPAFADLLIIDPPYNLNKNFNGLRFSEQNDQDYSDYLESWFPKLLRTLKPEGSVYICGDWRSSACLYGIMKKYMIVRNRVVWQREKGRGAEANWKNACEDIWFGTIGKTYYFNVDAVKQKRKVLAPYRVEGKPKDWEETAEGNFRLTHPGNFWDDISVPYWSMSENTDHPAQKPEKLIAKLILASCPEGGLVLDPFLGSGTTSVTAKKLGRNYTGIELNEEYCCWAEKRLDAAEAGSPIQGYADGVFWERNTLNGRNFRPGKPKVRGSPQSPPPGERQ